MSQAALSHKIGQPVRRREDLRLITGKGRFSDDVNLPGQVYAAMLRSPHADACIRAIDSRRALALPGVIAVFTGADFVADGMQPIPYNQFTLHPAEQQLPNSDGTPPFIAPCYSMAVDKARYVGEIVAVVIATSAHLARDGAEAVVVEYEVLPAVTATVAAAEPQAPRLWDEARSNVCVDADVGARDATAAAFARAAHVATLRTWIQRVTGVPMEPRAAVGDYDARTRRYTLHAGSGGSVRLKKDLALILAVPEEAVRVLMDDVGGNFGTRGMIYPEFALTPWAARRVGRPVKWTCDRSEAFVSDFQGRDLAVSAELALDAEGKFLAMRGANIGNAGGHTGSYTPLQKGVEIMSSIYRMPCANFRARAVVSNTAPTRPYRSSGRPEVMFVMERLKLVHEWLGVPLDSVRLITGDTDIVKVGGGTHSGRSMRMGSVVIWHSQCHYDPESGQLLTGSFMDYAMPRADNFPFFDTVISEVPCTTHPLGIRPAGEGGTTPALGATINAVVDALSEFGVKHIEMPATPERIWRAIREK